MKVTLGTAEFEATPLGLRILPLELGEAMGATTPQVKQWWACDTGKSKPNPAQTKITLPVNIGVHGATRRPPVLDFGGSIQRRKLRDAYRRARQQDVEENTARVADRLAKICGTAGIVGLDKALQKPFGRKVDVPIPFDTLIAPFKTQFSLRVWSTALYHELVLTHPDLPDLLEMEVILAIPYGLRHTLHKTHTCSEGKAEKIKYWKQLRPVHVQYDRLSAKGTGEVAVRKWLLQEEQARLARRQKLLDDEKAETEAELEKLAEDAAALEGE